MITVCIINIGSDPVNEDIEGNFISGMPDGMKPTIGPVYVKVETNKTEITINGINKQLVGEVAAKIRSFRRPEPYKGKGIRYKDEYVRSKQGRTVGGETAG